MERLLVYLITFITIYLIYFIFVISKKNKRKLYRESTEVIYLEKKYKINMNKINLKKLGHVLALANAFIIANTVLIVDFYRYILLKILVGFLITIPMIIVVYHLVAKYLKKRDEKDV